MVHGRSLPPALGRQTRMRRGPGAPRGKWPGARARTGLPAGRWRVRLGSDRAPVMDAMPRSGQELEVPLTLPAQESGDARPARPAAISRRRGRRSHSRVVAAGAQTSWSAASQGGESSAASSGSRAGAADKPPLWTSRATPRSPPRIPKPHGPRPPKAARAPPRRQAPGPGLPISRPPGRRSHPPSPPRERRLRALRRTPTHPPPLRPVPGLLTIRTLADPRWPASAREGVAGGDARGCAAHRHRLAAMSQDGVTGDADQPPPTPGPLPSAVAGTRTSRSVTIASSRTSVASAGT
jgi:hypothetical protein